MNSRGKNAACSSDDIWNPLVGPHDFTIKERWKQAKAFQVFFNFHASDEDRKNALHFSRYVEFNCKPRFLSRVFLTYKALQPLEQGCITFTFLVEETMYSGDQRFVSALHSALTTFSLRSYKYDFTKVRLQLSACAYALGPTRLPPDINNRLLELMSYDAGSPKLTKAISSLHGRELGRTLEGEAAFTRLLEILSTLE